MNYNLKELSIFNDLRPCIKIQSFKLFYHHLTNGVDYSRSQNPKQKRFVKIYYHWVKLLLLKFPRFYALYKFLVGSLNFLINWNYSNLTFHSLISYYFKTLSWHWSKSNCSLLRQIIRQEIILRLSNRKWITTSKKLDANYFIFIWNFNTPLCAE